MLPNTARCFVLLISLRSFLSGHNSPLARFHHAGAHDFDAATAKA
jgi:hypothetical protein